MLAVPVSGLLRVLDRLFGPGHCGRLPARCGGGRTGPTTMPPTPDAPVRTTDVGCVGGFAGGSRQRLCRHPRSPIAGPPARRQALSLLAQPRSQKFLKRAACCRRLPHCSEMKFTEWVPLATVGAAALAALVASVAARRTAWTAWRSKTVTPPLSPSSTPPCTSTASGRTCTPGRTADPLEPAPLPADPADHRTRRPMAEMGRTGRALPPGHRRQRIRRDQQSSSPDCPSQTERHLPRARAPPGSTGPQA